MDPPPPYQPLADALARHRELRRVTVFGIDATMDAPCSAIGGGQGWIISVSDGRNDASCVGDGQSVPQCIAFAGHDRDHLRHALCEQSAVPKDGVPPDWTTDLFQAATRLDADISLAPVGRGTGVDALWLSSIDWGTSYLGVATSSGWSWTDIPLFVAYRMYQHVEVHDTSKLTGDTSFAFTATASDGGSGSGMIISHFTIVRPDGAQLIRDVTLPISILAWTWNHDEKRRILRKHSSSPVMDVRHRPHIEVTLTPHFDAPRFLQLRVKTNRLPPKMRERFACDEADTECSLHQAEAVLQMAGLWEWNSHTRKLEKFQERKEP